MKTAPQPIPTICIAEPQIEAIPEEQPAGLIGTALRLSFEETHYRVHHEPPFTLRVGQGCGELDKILRSTNHDCAAFITAHNPGCQQLIEAENEVRQQALVAELQRRSLSWLPGTGQHPTNGWPGEESALALGLQVEAARALCMQFGQLACVVFRRGDIARLLVV